MEGWERGREGRKKKVCKRYCKVNGNFCRFSFQSWVVFVQASDLYVDFKLGMKNLRPSQMLLDPNSHQLQLALCGMMGVVVNLQRATEPSSLV